MTPLSDALKRATETAGQPIAGAADSVAPWEFEPAAEAAEPAVRPAITPLAARFSAAERRKVVVGKGVDRAVIEQYRHLAAMLHNAQVQNGVRRVMITSALASEGKTLTAANLAMTLSESYQRRVLLIDADLRCPRIQKMFSLREGAGLTDSLTLSSDGRLPVHQVSTTLWVLTAGRPLPDPMSALVSPTMKQLLEDARDAFDWVILDTPPVAILPDANLLASMIDTALVVVSAKATPYPMVQRAVEAIGASRVLGVVLNRTEKAHLSAGYGYYESRKVPGVQ